MGAQVKRHFAQILIWKLRLASFSARFGAWLLKFSRRKARRCLPYFQTNRERTRYLEFHEQGLCTSMGVVEVGCK
jgi:hypothetical protein